MNIKTAYTSHVSISQAVEDLRGQLSGLDAHLILFFASSTYDPVMISAQMQETFSKSQVMGCTTSGEIVSGKMLDNSIVAMAFNKSMISEAHFTVMENIIEDEKVVDKAFDTFSKQVGTSMDQLNPSQYVGLVLIDGLSGCEEKINERIGDLTSITFIGGSTGDDLRFERTYVYAHGKAYANAALLILLKPAKGFDILKTQSFRDSGKVLVVTEHDETKREISQFNHQPATKAYADALGLEHDTLLVDHMFKNPLGLMLGENEPFVRSPRVIEGDHILFYCNVKSGMELHLLHSTDIIEDTKLALEKKKQQLGNIGAIINFNCILRTLDLKQQGRTQPYADIFQTIPTVGFSTYGESYIGHINQTATMLLLKE